MSRTELMQLYNTQTSKCEPLRSAEDSQAGRPITIYACGITPYDNPHLGHVATAIRCAVLRRSLTLLGYAVTFVQNVTDIDDKIINRAKQRGEAPDVIARRYTEEYRREMEIFGIPAPDHEPLVTDEISIIIPYIDDLIGKGHGYQSPTGDVYFSITSAPSYGKLAGHDPEKLIAGTRERVRREKHHPLDFVLWKRSDDPIGTFDSPWGRGRPGWHTECCAMSNAILGETIDIHCGGLDLLFPHHENELAQAECRNRVPFVRCWFHLGLMLLDGVKMSKSEGNVITLEEARERWGVPLIIYNILSVHYRSPVRVEEDIFEERLNQILDLHWFDQQVAEIAERYCCTNGPATNDDTYAREIGSRCFEALKKDLNTPRVLAVIHEAVQRGIMLLSDREKNRSILIELRKQIRLFGETLLLFPPNYSFERLYGDAVRILGRRYQRRGAIMEAVTLDELGKLLDQREKLRVNRRFSEADAIRERLQRGGISCLDGSVRGWRFCLNFESFNGGS